MNFSLKKYRLLIFYFFAFALTRSVDSALGCVPQLEDDQNKEMITTSLHRFEHKSLLDILPSDLIQDVLMTLDCVTLSKVSEVSQYLNNFVREDIFQQRYCNLTLEDYADITGKQIPDAFGGKTAEIIQNFLANKPMYAYGHSLARLRNPTILTLLKGNKRTLGKALFVFFEGKGDAGIAKVITISSYASLFFTENMSIYYRFSFMKILAPLSIGKIESIGAYASQFFRKETGLEHKRDFIGALSTLSSKKIEAMSMYVPQIFKGMPDSFNLGTLYDLGRLTIEKIKVLNRYGKDFFVEDGYGYDKYYIRNFLAPLSVEKIKVLACYIPQFFPEHMSTTQRGLLIRKLDDLTLESIPLLAQSFTEDMTSEQRIRLIGRKGPKLKLT